MKRMTLSELADECLMLILQLRSARDYGDPLQLRNSINSLLEQLGRDAGRLGSAPEDTENIKFALVAFIDESIVASEWMQKEAWLANPLQLEMFNRYDAGDEFFNKLDQLKQQPSRNEEVLRVYFLCLALGFKGKYALHGQESLRRLIAELHSTLMEKGKEARLSPHPKTGEDLVAVVKRELPAWVIGVAALAVGLVVYFILMFLISGTASEVVGVLQQTP